jgi:hypothetical protein
MMPAHIDRLGQKYCSKERFSIPLETAASRPLETALRDSEGGMLVRFVMNQFIEVVIAESCHRE